MPSNERDSGADDFGAPHENTRREPHVEASPQPNVSAESVEIVTWETHHRPGTGGLWRRYPLSRADWVIAALLLLTAFAVRWPFIARGETLLHNDEAIVGIMAQDIADGSHYPIYFYGQRYMGALEAYVIAAASPLFADPIHALRFGPACFFALMVFVQYLMLARWFGRFAAVVGAAVLLCAPPMIMQWTISARGGYVEILLWGSMLLWAYSEWFVPPTPIRRRAWHRLAFGLLLGSGMWINPSIVLFVLPIALHALMNRPLAALNNSGLPGPALNGLRRKANLATLPILAIAAVLLLNLTWATWVQDGRVHSLLLLGTLPKPVAAGLLVVAGTVFSVFIAKRTPIVAYIREFAQANALIIVGMLIGAAPAALYSIQAAVGLRQMDPSLPLGFRPLWLIGEPLLYLLHGLPLLFGADAQSFLALVNVGRDATVRPLSIPEAGIVSACNWLVLGSLVTCAAILLLAYRRDWLKLLRCEAVNHAPIVLLAIGAAVSVGLYLLGGCTFDFTTIRYLVPLFVFVPGLLAAVVASGWRSRAAIFAPIVVCLAWGVGQFVMLGQLGAPHPLRKLADALEARSIDPATAEILDAHLLSYMTRQKCKTLEYRAFWPRLSHYREQIDETAPMDYIVRTGEMDRAEDWLAGGWPGKCPVETKRFLWPRLRHILNNEPDRVLLREPLPDGYERIRLARPLPLLDVGGS